MWTIVGIRFTNIYVYVQPSLKVSEKQSTIGYLHRCGDENCVTALADAYRIFDDNQYCILCVDDATCAIVKIANCTYYMFHPQS